MNKKIVNWNRKCIGIMVSWSIHLVLDVILNFLQLLIQLLHAVGIKYPTLKTAMHILQVRIPVPIQLLLIKIQLLTPPHTPHPSINRLTLIQQLKIPMELSRDEYNFITVYIGVDVGLHLLMGHDEE